MKGLKKVLVLIFGVIQFSQGFSQSSQRIVSLAPMITKMIYRMEAKDQLVGCTNYCELAIKDHKTVVSTGMEVNIEKILLLKPDIVITTTLTNQSTIEELKKVGLKVNVCNIPNSYTELCDLFIELSKLTGKYTLASGIIEKQQRRLFLLNQKIPKMKKLRVLFEIGTKPLFAVIPNTFMNDYILYAGCENIASDLKSGLISKESVLLRNPDIILIVTMGILAAEEKTMWNQYPNLNASKNGKIFLIDSDNSCSPDPVIFVDTVEQIITMVYP